MQVNFLRLLKACATGLLKQGDSESLSRETVTRYKQYVRALSSYAEELQRASEDGGAAARSDAPGGQASKRAQRCSLSPDEMAQHQQKVLLIEEALQAAVRSLDGAAEVSGVQARTDKSALTTVSTPWHAQHGSEVALEQARRLDAGWWVARAWLGIAQKRCPT